ncbi:Thymidylate kinase [Alteracholeplasma palmae J233]|uniref:Thymidylate kinase n=1 Tax=Alteracholeplasma palmae (strain ATCC 49389 / J233) TaxID=1318466 RepID=U4KM21_ALTPJ|nr:thymidylate kinase [Alteracholeplasma palmae]CCV65003.1 Thymidylate kinase [Alteracholeplasma palmae J233]
MKKNEEKLRVTYPSRSPQMLSLNNFKGTLIVFEGMDGAGKSTQINKLINYLSSKSFESYSVNFLRSTFTKDITSMAKWKNSNPITRVLIDSLGLYEEINNIFLESLKEKRVIILDRYIYTILSRYSVRGIDKNWLKSLLSLLPQPDIIFYIKTNIETCLERKKGSMLSYWECGCDIYGSDPSIRESYSFADYSNAFIKYQTSLDRVMKKILPHNVTYVLNGNLNENDLHNDITKQLRERGILE